MYHRKLKVARIGNSRGVRLPALTLERYRIGDTLLMEERTDGILLRRPGHTDSKLSWEDTARAMAASPEDWSEWDTTSSDRLDEYVWPVEKKKRVAERKPKGRKAGRGNSR